VEELIAKLDPTTWGGLLALYLLSGLFSMLFARRSQVDAWAESHPRLAAVLKLLRSLGLDPWMLLQSLSLLVRGRLPQSAKSPPHGPSHLGPALLLLLAGALLGGAYACSAPPPEENARAENATVLILRTSTQIADPVWEEPDRIIRTPVCGGTALDVGDGKIEIVTAKHCLHEGATSVAIQTRTHWFVHPSDYAIADVLRRSPTQDLVWLRAREPVDFTELSTQSPERVLLLREEFGTTRAAYSEGVVSGLDSQGLQLEVGDSGFGAFDDDGKQVAVMTRCFTDAADMCDARGGITVRP